MLTTSLLACQISLLIGYVLRNDDAMCNILGVVTHYLALSVHCSLLICSYHVYTIFTTMYLSQNIPRENRTFFMYVIFVITVPGIIVAVVALISFLINSDDLGYGDAFICFLRKHVLAWTVMFVPSVVVLSVNVVLFCLTYASLRQNEDIETNITDEKHVHFYLRVNIMVALTWLFYVLSVAAEVRAMLFLFLVLQCICGIYMFVALVLSRRVTALLFTLCCEDRTDNNVTSMRMNNGASAKEPAILATAFRKTSTDYLDYDLNIHVDRRLMPQADTNDTHF